MISAGRPESWVERLKHSHKWRQFVRRSFGDNISQLDVLNSLTVNGELIGPVLIGLGSAQPNDNNPPIQTLVYANLDITPPARIELKPLLCAEDFGVPDEIKRHSTEVSLYYERIRGSIANGVNSFTVNYLSSWILITTCSGLFVYRDGGLHQIAEWWRSEPLNAEFCPTEPSTVAFYSEGNLHIDHMNRKWHSTDDGQVRRRTTRGAASFVVQEELERFTGFWWNPISVELIYEEVHENEVAELSFVTPGKPPQRPMLYPLTGTPNPKSKLHFLTLDNDGDGWLDLVLPFPLEYYAPDYEYISRVDWAGDGQSFYVVLLDRCQKNRTVLLISRKAFFADPDAEKFPVNVLYTESSPIWINETNSYCVLPERAVSTQLIYASEKDDFCHLYLRSWKNDAFEDMQITGGEWPIIREASPVIDTVRKHIYYLANAGSPLITSLCVSSYESQEPHILLTPADLCVKFDRSEASINVNPRIGFACWLSKLTQMPECRFYRLRQKPFELPTAELQFQISLQPLIPPSLSPDQSSPGRISAYNDPGDETKKMLPVSSLFRHSFEEVKLEDGTVIHCLVLLPVKSDTGDEKFPVIQYVYGGPGLQVVKDNWLTASQFLKFVTVGYAIVIADNRGSQNRGLKFEGAIQQHLGTVEVADQLYALRALAERIPELDMSRVGVTGWSYGGYMSLRMLAEHGDVYKGVCAGGAVVDWQLYDTCYTERYMGMPAEYADKYRDSSVLSKISRLPDEENRLMIVHGLMDENVHFHHTEKLVNALVNMGKPHKLLIFPSERHGIRKAEAVEYLHASMLSFFDSCL